MKSSVAQSRFLLCLSVLILSMNTFAAVPVSALHTTSKPAYAQIAQKTNLASEIDSTITSLVKSGAFSGAVLVARKGEILFKKSYGLANRELNVPNTPETKYRIASMTKQFIATAILILQEEGKLSVKDPICKYIKDCPATWKPITIHHLLTHTSGIPSYKDDPGFPAIMMMPLNSDEVTLLFRDKPLRFTPGTGYLYSNSGYHLLGVIVGSVSTQSWDVFLKKRIFDPLGMNNTGYDQSGVLLPNRASGYMDHGKANPPYYAMSAESSAGSLYSTVDDLLRWDQALANHKLISKKSLEQMFVADPASASGQEPYGYGWIIATKPKRVWHDGWVLGFGSYIGRYLDDNLLVVILANYDYADFGPANLGAQLGEIALKHLQKA